MHDDDTIGAALARARAERGLSLEDVARTTRVRLEFLRAIEAMDARALPERPYALGFVRAYAAEVGLNAQDAADAFTVQTVSARRTAPVTSASPRPAEPLELPLRAALASVAALGAAGLTLWALSGDDAPRPEDEIPPVPEALRAWVAASPGSQEGARALAALTAQDGPVITLQARLSVWVEVTSATGDRVFAGELRAGQTYSAPQQPGLLVSAHNGGGVEVLRDGEAIGLLGDAGLPVTGWAVDDARFSTMADLSPR